MKFRIVLITLLPIIAVRCNESGSAEANKIEMSPFYDTIIFGDVAEVFNEFENGMNPLEALITSASDSEENLEDLLFEYQHYLDRAHNQRMNYLEKAKTKNKVPLTRHDRFSKTKPAGGNAKYDDYFYSGGYLSPTKFSSPQYGTPLDIFLPVSDKLRYMGKTNIHSTVPKEGFNFEKEMLELSPVMPKSRMDPIKSSCLCKSMQLPCDCQCKQCLIYDPVSKNYYQHPKYLTSDSDKGFLPNADYTSEGKLGDDNTLNIRIKVDIQVPKTKEMFTKSLKNRSREELNSKETTVSVPFPYFNFPIPMDLLGYKTSSKYSTHEPSHKISMHKKKKSRANNGNKKHKKKVVLHNFNMKPQHHKIQPYIDEPNTSAATTTTTTSSTTTASSTTTELNDSVTKSSSQADQSNTIVSTTAIVELVLDNNKTAELNGNIKDNIMSNNISQTDDSIYVMVNISNSSDNIRDDAHKIENSVETELPKIDKNISTDKISMSRRKRFVVSKQTTTSIPKEISVLVPKKNTALDTKETTQKMSHVNKVDIVAAVTNFTIPQKNINDNKKIDKTVLADSELEYWPINKNLTDYTSKNITTIILDREDKKVKLNMTKEIIRNNRTTVLEKAIFGDVNWDDVDTVAPVFLSFVGKYMRGVLTFCSQNVCHSMKCAEKSCVHRICHASNRWNQRGHCAGSNKTDSIVSLESIMDLPSNVAFEIADILQDKMLGKLFGKVTLCINSKCITFIAIKKSFLKSKCSVKDLKGGHCPNIKNSKIL